jgi:hypothetical protein
MTSNNNYSVQIRKRPWWFWAIAVVWLLIVLFFLNVGAGSTAELQPQAATMGYVTAVVLFILGGAGYLFERKRAK